MTLCILLQSACVSNQQTMLLEEPLKGRVKTVSKYHDGELYSTNYFDAKGRLAKNETRYNENGSIRITEYFYDERGRLTHSIRDSADNPYQGIRYDYKLNRRGLIASCRRVDSGWTTYYDYDFRGNCIMEREPDAHLGKYKKRIYNRKSRLVEDFSYDTKGGVLHAFGTDDEGNHWEEDYPQLPYEGWHTFYEYNKRGEVIRLRVEESDKALLLTDNITYEEYDKAGNWIKRLHDRTSYYYSLDDDMNQVCFGSESYDSGRYPNRDSDLFQETGSITRVIEYYE